MKGFWFALLLLALTVLKIETCQIAEGINRAVSDALWSGKCEALVATVGRAFAEGGETVPAFSFRPYEKNYGHLDFSEGSGLER